MLPHDAMVVVADGRSATLFRNVSRHGLHLEPSENLNPVNGRAGLFAAALAQHLNDLAVQQRFDDIAIIADPQTLGELRKLYNRDLQLRLRREIAQAARPDPDALIWLLH